MNEKQLDDPEAFVTTMYRGILNREPDKGGLEAAVKSIKNGVTGEAFIRGMLASEEFQSRRSQTANPESNFPDMIVTALYRGILNREPDKSGFEGAVSEIKAGVPCEKIIERMLASEEFQSKQTHIAIPVPTLPDLTKLMPEYYEKSQVGDPIFKAEKDSDFDLMEELIQKHHYYDSFGVWAPKIDIDKRITAAIARGLGGKSVFEMGCFTGPVLSLLHQAGIDVTGIDVSHLAFILAYPDIRSRMIFGDLLSYETSKKFDVVLGMDILEHLNPIRLGKYIARIASMVDSNGFVYINSPMFGPDRIFGNPFPVYIPEWERVGNASFWRRLHCDKQGWPMHGHLVWASPGWWEEQFKLHGLVRDGEIETAIHGMLVNWFKISPGRRSLFVLKPSTNQQRSTDVAERVLSALASVEGFPKSPA